MPKREFKPSVTVGNGNEMLEEGTSNVEEDVFTKEEEKGQLLLHEEDFIQGLIDAAGYSTEERQRIEIIREGRLFFAFHIRPLAEEEYERCRRKYTKYVRNKRLGMKTPEETNSVKYRDALIYQATVEEDREKLWDNMKVWETLREKDLQIMNGLDVIEYSLKAGEKDRVLEAIDKLSGYGENLEEVAKN